MTEKLFCFYMTRQNFLWKTFKNWKLTIVDGNSKLNTLDGEEGNLVNEVLKKEEEKK